MHEFLRIGGFTPLTTLDYPGELCAVVFCQGCPWRCRYCHNGHLLPARSETRIPWSEVHALLARRVGLLDAVVFSGGEPTLQPALPAAIEQARSMGFKIGLHTAGPYPDRLRRLLPLLDWVGLDIKALPDDYPQITCVSGSGAKAWKSLEVLLDFGIALEVRTTVMPGWTWENYLPPLMDELARLGVREFVLQWNRSGIFPDRGVDEDHSRSLAENRIAIYGNRLFKRFSFRTD